MAHRRISFILAALMALLIIPFGAAKPALAADFSNIRVLLSIGSGVQSFGMSVNGSYFIKENGVSFSGGTLTAQYSGGKVVLTHSSMGQIYSGSSVNIMRERIDPSAGYIRATVGGAVRSYLGHFLIKTSGSGLRVINTVPLPHYLYGVVRGEMGNSFPLEALKAQAIAAKSYVLSPLTGSGEYDIGDTAEDQVYKGYSASETMVIAAVDATYDIGLYLGNNILRAYYAASNGGSTLLPSDVWSGTNRYQWDAAYARVTDPYDTSNPLTPQETILLAFNGDAGMSSSVSSRLKSAITTALSSAGYSGISVTRIDSINSFEKTSTYNASLSLNLTFSNGQSQSLKCSVDMRALMSSAQRNSMRLFVVTQTSQGYQVFQGRYGHGVGMSQRGAEQMANQGMRYDQILSFYYPGATLRSMGITAPTDPAKPSGSSSTPSSTSEIIATAVTTGSVNFRKGPSTSTASMGTIPKGTSLNIYGTDGEFAIAQYNGQTGYVHSSFLTITPVSSSSATPPENTGTALGAGAKGTVKSETYMRTSASSSGAIVAKLLGNVALDLLSDSGNYYYAHVQGYQGYVLKSDINVTNAGTSGSSDTSGSGSFTATGVTTGNVNFRKGAGTNTSIIKQLAKGTTFNIYSKANGWYHVNVAGTDGYLSATYVKETGSVSGTPDTSGGSSSGSGTTVTAYGVTTGSVNFRKGPGTNNAIIRMLAKNTALEIYSKANGWYHVNVGGTQGYVSAAYVKETSAPASSSGSSASRTGESTAQVNLRKSASSNSTLIKKLPKGTTFTIYSLSGNWYSVNVNGTEGYLHKDYVKETTGTSSSTGSSGSTSGAGFSAVIINDWVWLRSTPEVKGDNSNAMQQVAVGTSITVYSQNGEFYKSSVNGTIGYLHKDYVKILAAN